MRYKFLITVPAHKDLTEENMAMMLRVMKSIRYSICHVSSYCKHSCFLCGLFLLHTSRVPKVFNTLVSQSASRVTHLSTPPRYREEECVTICVCMQNTYLSVRLSVRAGLYTVSLHYYISISTTH